MPYSVTYPVTGRNAYALATDSRLGGPFLLLFDGVSKLLLTDGVSRLLITNAVAVAPGNTPTYYLLGF